MASDLPPADSSSVLKFDHARFVVGNALQAATFYVARFGFEPFAYAGLETGSRELATHVIRQGNILFSFETALQPASKAGAPGKAAAAELGEHGDHVKDVAFTVDDARAVWQQAVDRGAESARDPEELEDDDGKVVMAAVRTYGNVVHTFVERKAYTGVFLPGFKRTDEKDPLSEITPPVGLEFIDHVVGNQPDQQMVPVVEWYEKMLGFHRFWSVDDKVLHTEYSSLRSTVMASKNEMVKLPLNEPAESKKKSQIQEYVDFYSGAGVQHVALRTENIIDAITHLRARGLKFLRVPDTYYELLRERLAAQDKFKVAEDLDVVQKLGILLDFDDEGYLLQLFTKPLEDRPTLFFEIIQRRNNQGFGIGNFKSLFESIEREQELRGNL